MAFKRLRILIWLFAVLVGAVEARLFHLQFVERDFWEAEARKTRTGGNAVPFRRGTIYDRYGRPLAEGRTVHNVEFRYHEFRRTTPIGLLIGANRMLADEVAFIIDDVLYDPEGFVEAALAGTPAWLDDQPRLFRGDYSFYLARLLDLTEVELRDAFDGDGDRRPFAEIFPAAAEEIVAAVHRQERAIRELAESCEADPDELLLALDDHILDIDEKVAESIARASEPPGVKRRRAIRKDHESRPEVVLQSIPYRSVFLVNLVPERYRGFGVRDVDARFYPEEYASIAPLLIGRTGYPTEAVLERTSEDQRRFSELLSRPPEEIDVDMAEEIDALRGRLRHVNYKADEEMGISGLEALLEPVLRGRRGWKIEEWDRRQRNKQLLHKDEPVHGQDVVLTLDASLQLAAERVLAEQNHPRPAAIVLLDARDGAIRALASWPNPSRDDIRTRYGELLADGLLKPLYHRAYRPPDNAPRPGSVFKLIAAAAALERGVLTPGTTIQCDGVLRVGPKTRLQCSKRRAHGLIDLDRALEKSCNIFFYKLARQITSQAMFEMADRFGVGVETGFGDPDRLGLGWPSRKIHELLGPFDPPKYGADVMRMAVGQAGFGDLNALQLALIAAPFSNGGYRVHPYLVDEIGGQRAPRAAPTRVGMSPSTIDIIRRGMVKVTATDAGTAGPSKGYDLTRWGVVGKTGTPIDNFDVDGDNDGNRTQDLVYHSCFAGFFPFQAPKLVFAVYGENVGNDLGGGSFGNPILGALLSQPEMSDYLEGRGR